MDPNFIDIEKFITLVEPFTCLWDTGDSDYNDRSKKQQCWMQISKQISGDDFDDLTAVEKNEYGKFVQRKWKNLRNSFARELAKRRHHKKGSGAKWKTYTYFDQLSFLLRCASDKPTTSRHTDDSQQTQYPVLEESNDTAVSSVSFHNEIKSSPKDDGDASFEEISRERIKPRETCYEQELDQDDDRHFLLSLLGDLRRVPIERKMDAKIGMIQAIKTATYTSTPAVMSHRASTSQLPCPTTSSAVSTDESVIDLFT